MQISGTSVLVTGASQGLGAALSRELAGRGARVVLVARRKNELEAVVRGIRERGGEAHAVVGDVSGRDATYSIAGAAAALVGPIDLLVHSASTLGKIPLPLLLDTACEDLAHVLEVNLIGPFRLSKAVAGSMAVRGRGLVVHITSDASVEAYPGWGAYSVSKAALDHMARVWGAELAPRGVGFVSVDPGEMDTQMHADAIPDADRAALARPEDVARRLVDFIASDEPRGAGARVVLGALATGGRP
jgi:NAD(P)-dependent dehydrogenase (short-subunit alcohol dehydrogenase family)